MGSLRLIYFQEDKDARNVVDPHASRIGFIWARSEAVRSTNNFMKKSIKKAKRKVPFFLEMFVIVAWEDDVLQQLTVKLSKFWFRYLVCSLTSSATSIGHILFKTWRLVRHSNNVQIVHCTKTNITPVVMHYSARNNYPRQNSI